MNWKEVNDRYSVSDCGLYSVCLVSVVGDDGDVTAPFVKRWEAWTVGKRSRQTENLATRLRYQHEAKEICEAHALACSRVPLHQAPE